jgi:hypothetical protein
MDNVEIYKHGTFQLKISYNMGYEKITKPDICNSQQYIISKPQNLIDFIIFMESRI